MDGLLEWMKNNWFLGIIILFAFFGLLNLMIKWFVNLIRLPKYRAFNNYRKLKKGMTHGEVERILYGAKIKKNSSCMWTVRAKWRVKINCDEKYELRIYFDSKGELLDLKMSTTTETWYRR